MDDEVILKKSVLKALDGNDLELFEYLPYIFQDFWEFGTCPNLVINLIRKHKNDYPLQKVLDLGCGKGAVCINIANEFTCNCLGVDAVKEFINEAKLKAKKYKVEKFCEFEYADIRNIKLTDNYYDVIILGAIGPVLGNYYSTLTKLKEYLSVGGIIIIDDAYADESANIESIVETKTSILEQIDKTGMKLIDEIIIPGNEIKKTNEQIFDKIKHRCSELMEKEPLRKQIFLNYINNQARENEVLENQVINSIMVIAH